MDLDAIRAANLADLTDRGFRVTPGPIDRAPRALRPIREIAHRLLAIEVVLSWVLRTEREAPAASIRTAVEVNGLERVMTKGELAIYHRDRLAAAAHYTEALAWRLESLWPLAWILGFDPAPTLDGQLATGALVQSILGFLPPRDQPACRWQVDARSVEDIVRLEDRFACCHAAVRCAQLGDASVPARFHPVVHGGVIHERRHALTWALSPNTAWDDTDLG